MDTNEEKAKVLVLPSNTFQNLGYELVSHEDGFVYFKKENETTSSSEIMNTSAPPSISTSDYGNSGLNIDRFGLNHFEVDNSTLPQNVEDGYVGNLETIQEKPALRLSQIDPKVECQWARDIEDYGYARCFFESCNFISSSLSTMKYHFTLCDGEAQFTTNLCTACGCWLISDFEKNKHVPHCSGKKFGSRSTQVFIPEPLVSKVVVPVSLQNNKAPRTSVSVKPSILRRPMPKPSSPTSINDGNVIIQPRPPIPKGTYYRRRAYTPVHMECWKLKLSDYKCIPCHFQNCRFIALSLEDMAEHFRFCRGDSSYAAFKCIHCHGSVTSAEFLAIHISRSHPEALTFINENEDVCIKTEEYDSESFVTSTVQNTTASYEEENCETPTDGSADYYNPSQYTIQDGGRSCEPCEYPSASILSNPQPFLRHISQGGIKKVVAVSSNDTAGKATIKTYSREKKIISNRPTSSGQVHLKSSTVGSIQQPKPHFSGKHSKAIENNILLTGKIGEGDFNGMTKQSIKSSATYNSATPSEGGQVYQSGKDGLLSADGIQFVNKEMKNMSMVKVDPADSRKEVFIKRGNIVIKVPLASCAVVKTMAPADSNSEEIPRNELINLPREISGSGGTIENEVNVSNLYANRSSESVLVPSETDSAPATCEENNDRCLKRTSESETPCDRGQIHSEPHVIRDNLPEEDEDEPPKEIIRSNLSEEGPDDDPATEDVSNVSNEGHGPPIDAYPETSYCDDDHSQNAYEVKENCNVKTNFEISTVSVENNIIHSSPKTVEGAPFRCSEDITNHQSNIESQIGFSNTAEANKGEEVNNSTTIDESIADDPLHVDVVQSVKITRNGGDHHAPPADDSTQHFSNSESSVLILPPEEPLQCNADVYQSHVPTHQPFKESCPAIGTSDLSGEPQLSMKTEGSSMESVHSRRLKGNESNEKESVASKIKSVEVGDDIKDSISKDASSQVVKRPRGRPRKKEVAAVEDFVEDSVRHTRRSAARKRVPSEADSSNDDKPLAKRIKTDKTPKVTSIKSKGGRSAKIPKTTETKSDCLKTEGIQSDSEEDEKPASKRSPKKRGKKKKVVGNKRTCKFESDDDYEPLEKSTENQAGSKHASDDDDETDEEKVERKGGKKKFLPDKQGAWECSLCNKTGKSNWTKHNSVAHYGLGWAKDEPPLDLKTADSKLVLALVREAFKYIKCATCPLCNSEKRSFLGFHAHIMMCGKTGTEMEEVFVACEQCGKKVLPYSMSTHLRNCRVTSSMFTKTEDEAPLGKRRSAVKALETLKEAAVEENKKLCFYYEKGKIYPSDFQLKLSGSAGRGYACVRKGCDVRIYDLKNARQHSLMCPTMPGRYYQCLTCTFYTEVEDEANAHTQCKDTAPEYCWSTNSEAEYDEEDEEVAEEKPRKKYSAPKNVDIVKDSDICLFSRKAFSARNNLTGHFGFSLAAFSEEYKDAVAPSQRNDRFPEMCTRLDQWRLVDENCLPGYLPQTAKSLPVAANDSSFETLDRFQFSKKPGVTAGFVGGNVLSMCWRPTSAESGSTAHQTLAISVSCYGIDVNPSVLSSPTGPSLVQIWDFGCLGYEKSIESVRGEMVMGLALDHGHTWGLAWSPVDTSIRTGTESNFLPRLGLLATASQDGFVRIFSICQPEELKASIRNPVYKLEESVRLRFTEESEEDACLCVSWGANDVICAGFRSGSVAVWRLEQLTSNRVKTCNGVYILDPFRSFLAHGHPVTEIASCPCQWRLFATTGYDKNVKLWDVISGQRGSDWGGWGRRFVWSRQWPRYFYLIDTNSIRFESGQVLRGNEMTMHSPNQIMDTGASEWLNLEAMTNAAGDVILRSATNPITDKKRNAPEWVLSRATLTAANKADGRKTNEVVSYEQAVTESYGIRFEDNYKNRKTVSKTNEQHVVSDELTSAQKMVFNPNFPSFGHIAVGYRCGILRILKIDGTFRKDIDVAIKKSSKPPSTA